jgi:hypothetical protein
MKKSVFLTVLLSLLLASTAFALEPGDTLWTHTYGGSGTDYCYSVQQTSDGGYVAAGYTDSFGAGGRDFYLVKTDENGDTLWARTYGGSSTDYGYSVRETSDGGYIVTGYTDSFGVGYEDAYLVKTDANGDTLWTRTYGWSTGKERAHCVQPTSDGGYIIVGYTYSYETYQYDFYLVKTDANGDTLWTRTYGGSGTEKAESVQQTTDGSYIVAGYTSSFGAGLVDAWLVKVGANGNFLWAQSYGGSNWDYVYSVQQTSDGGYILAGYEDSFGAGSKDVWSIKTDDYGDTLWTRTYGGSGDDRAYSSQQTTDGGYTIAGCTNSFGAGGFDVWLIKTDANGDTSWTRTYGGSATDRAECVQQTSDGGYVVAGATQSFGAGSYDLWLVRVAGEQLPAVTIEIVPDDPPVTVPQGGSFGFTGTLTNNTEDPQITDAWTMAVGPLEGVYGPFKEFYDFPLDPGETHSAHFYQRVPNLAPLGFYDYIAYCGDYPATVMDSSFFQIEVIAGPLTKAGESGWVLTGSFLEGDLADIPFAFALLGNYPNPFNATTVIAYELPRRADVRLEVYNISGQKVATLVDGEQQAGYRSITWNASEVSSGVYFYKLTAGDFSEIKTMTLLR